MRKIEQYAGAGTIKRMVVPAPFLILKSIKKL